MDSSVTTIVSLLTCLATIAFLYNIPGEEPRRSESIYDVDKLDVEE